METPSSSSVHGARGSSSVLKGCEQCLLLVCSLLPSLPAVTLCVFPWPGYSEDGGALRGEVIPEHEFATGPVCLDDENEFPPVSIRDP